MILSALFVSVPLQTILFYRQINGGIVEPYGEAAPVHVPGGFCPAKGLNLPNPQQSKVSSNPPSIYRVILRSLMPKFCIGVPRRQRRYVNVWIIIAEFDGAKQIDVLPRHG